MKEKNYERSKKHPKWKTSSRSKGFVAQSGDKPIYLLCDLFYFLCFSFNMFTLMVPYTILFLTKKKKYTDFHLCENCDLSLFSILWQSGQ